MTASWRRYARFWGAHVDDDVDQELAFHIEMRVHDYIAAGMTERDARREAEHRFGNSGRIRDNCRTIGHRRQRHMQRAQTIDALVQDVRYGLRTLRRQKGWTAVALLTMALGIGASTAVFSAVNSLILHPSPYRDANRLAMVWRAEPKHALMIPPDKAMLDVMRSQTKIFDGIEEFAGNQMTVTGRGDAVDVGVSVIEANLPEFAGMPLLRGRTFLPDEMIPGGRPVVIIGEDLWRQRFGESTDAIGARLMLNDKPYTIVGVAPSRLRLPQLGQLETSAWLPLIKDSSYIGGMVLARLREGVTFDAATKLVTAAVAPIAKSEPGSLQFQIRFVRPADLVPFKGSLYLLGGAVVLLLLVSCANVAHLLLARGATRERELSVRAALGAGRWRLARQLLTESGILAAAGCVAGVALGFAAVRALSVLRPDSLKALSRTQVDGRVLLIAVLASMLAGFVFGCIGALHALRRTSAESLRDSAASSSAPRSHRLRSLLVISEMALSALLLVGAALLTRSVINLQHIDRGFDSKNLFSMKLVLPRERYATSQVRRAFVDRVVDAAGHLPGVVAVTAANATPPLSGGIFFAPIEIEGGSAGATPFVMPMNFVSPNYFQVLGIKLEGSTFTSTSAENEDVIINRGFAQKYWPGQSAVGHRFRFADGKQKADADWKRIIGVADNLPSGDPGADRGAPFTYSFADPKSVSPSSVIAVRVREGINPTLALQQIVKSIDNRLAPSPVTTVDADLTRTFATQRFTMILLTVFAVVAVLLSAIGLYGVTAYVVTQRTREIGIRVTLGASPMNVASAIVARGLALSVVGLALGLVASIWGSALIKSALFGVTGTDATSYAIAGGALLCVSAIACFVPMRRAMRVDPAIAMRSDN